MLSILIVEDSTVIRQRLRSLLRESASVGLIAQAETEAEALAYLGRLTPDMAIIDLRLRSGSGLGVVRYLKSHVPACLVVVLTSAPLAEIQEACLHAGADHVLRKSKDFERLLEFLESLESQKSAARSETDKL
jgi:DNA-binding NarL/FixJ family response regulator